MREEMGKVVADDAEGEAGDSQRGEPWRSKHDERLRLLFFTALMRVFTAGQSARYLGGDPKRARATLGLLESERLVGGVEVKMPREWGGKARAYYLTLRGLKEVRRFAPDIAALARAGRPGVSARTRVPHDLLVTEAYLYIHGRSVVHDFLPESALRAKLLRARATPNGLTTAARAESVGDFKVLAERRGSRGGPKWVECEAALRLDSDQIARKPKGLVWFVASRRKADAIEAERGERVFTLGDPRAPFKEGAAGARHSVVGGATRRRRRRPMMALRARALEKISGFGGAATASAVAAALNLDRSGVSRCLAQLEREGKLRSEGIHYRPGRERGRPAQLYALASSPPLTLDERTRQLTLSHILTALAKAGMRVTAYAGEFWTLWAVNERDAVSPRLVAVVDDPTRPVEEILGRVTWAKLKFGEQDARFVVMMAREERMAALRALDSTVEIRDVRKPLGGRTERGADVAEAA